MCEGLINTKGVEEMFEKSKSTELFEIIREQRA